MRYRLMIFLVLLLIFTSFPTLGFAVGNNASLPANPTTITGTEAWRYSDQAELMRVSIYFAPDGQEIGGRILSAEEALIENIGVLFLGSEDFSRTGLFYRVDRYSKQTAYDFMNPGLNRLGQRPYRYDRDVFVPYVFASPDRHPYLHNMPDVIRTSPTQALLGQHEWREFFIGPYVDGQPTYAHIEEITAIIRGEERKVAKEDFMQGIYRVPNSPIVLEGEYRIYAEPLINAIVDASGQVSSFHGLIRQENDWTPRNPAYSLTGWLTPAFVITGNSMVLVRPEASLGKIGNDTSIDGIPLSYDHVTRVTDRAVIREQIQPTGHAYLSMGVGSFSNPSIVDPIYTNNMAMVGVAILDSSGREVNQIVSGQSYTARYYIQYTGEDMSAPVEVSLIDTSVRDLKSGTLSYGSTSYSTANYRYIRWHIDRKRNDTETSPYLGSRGLIQVARFQLMKDGHVVAFPSGTSTTNPDGLNPPGEGPANLIDGSFSTKWLDARFNGFLSSTGDSVITITMPHGVEFDSYRLTTANDFANRDPVGWTLSVSENGFDWKEVDRAINLSHIVPLDRHQNTAPLAIRTGDTGLSFDTSKTIQVSNGDTFFIDLPTFVAETDSVYTCATIAFDPIWNTVTTDDFAEKEILGRLKNLKLDIQGITPSVTNIYQPAPSVDTEYQIKYNIWYDSANDPGLIQTKVVMRVIGNGLTPDFTYEFDTILEPGHNPRYLSTGPMPILNQDGQIRFEIEVNPDRDRPDRELTFSDNKDFIIQTVNSIPSGLNPCVGTRRLYNQWPVTYTITGRQDEYLDSYETSYSPRRYGPCAREDWVTYGGNVSGCVYDHFLDVSYCWECVENGPELLRTVWYCAGGRNFHDTQESTRSEDFRITAVNFNSKDSSNVNLIYQTGYIKAGYGFELEIIARYIGSESPARPSPRGACNRRDVSPGPFHLTSSIPNRAYVILPTGQILTNTDMTGMRNLLDCRVSGGGTNNQTLRCEIKEGNTFGNMVTRKLYVNENTRDGRYEIIVCTDKLTPSSPLDDTPLFDLRQVHFEVRGKHTDDVTTHIVQ